MFSAASSQYSMSKSIHFPGRAEKDPRSVHEWWSSEGVGIEAGAGLCQEEDWLWSSGSANTVCPRGLFCCKVTPHFSAQNCSLAVAPFPTIEE